MANNLVDQTGVGADKNKVTPQTKGVVPGAAVDPKDVKPVDKASVKDLTPEEKRVNRVRGYEGTAPVDTPTKSRAGRPNHVSEHIGIGGVPTGEMDPNLDREKGVNERNT